MHDYDRTSLEAGYGEYEGEYGYESEGEGESYETYGETYGESPFSEAEEMELASELLNVSNEQELEQFLGDLFKKAGRALGKFVKSPVVKNLTGIVKGAIKTALPTAAGALGNMLLPGIGGVVGSQLASGASSILGLELEGLSNEDQEYEAARQLVRFAGAAAGNAADAPPNVPPQQAAQSAAVTAAQQYAPGLLRQNGAGQRHGRCVHKHSGKWIRQGNAIILLGAG